MPAPKLPTMPEIQAAIVEDWQKRNEQSFKNSGPAPAITNEMQTNKSAALHWAPESVGAAKPQSAPVATPGNRLPAKLK